MVRYRTRDICVLSHEKCSCGRTHVRMSKPMGRSDDMLIIKGVNVFPSQVETVLIEHGYSPNYQLVVDRVNNSDTLDINVEMNPDMFRRQPRRNHRARERTRQRAQGLPRHIHESPPRRAEEHPAQRRQGRPPHRQAQNITDGTQQGLYSRALRLF